MVNNHTFLWDGFGSFVAFWWNVLVKNCLVGPDGIYKEKNAVVSDSTSPSGKIFLKIGYLFLLTNRISWENVLGILRYGAGIQISLARVLHITCSVLPLSSCTVQLYGMQHRIFPVLRWQWAWLPVRCLLDCEMVSAHLVSLFHLPFPQLVRTFMIYNHTF